MRRAALLLALLVAIGPARAEEVEVIAAIQRTGAAQFDPTLPTVFLETWLRHALPKGAVATWETNDCGEQAGDAALDAGRDFPTCVGVSIDAPSRARWLYLLFDPEDKAFIVGAMGSPEAAGDVYFEELGLVPAMLDQRLVLAPLRCPGGAEPVIESAFAGSVETCRKDGQAHGPYRSWFQTGLYLMERGENADGARTGRWITCDRFESCREARY